MNEIIFQRPDVDQIKSMKHESVYNPAESVLTEMGRGVSFSTET